MEYVVICFTGYLWNIYSGAMKCVNCNTHITRWEKWITRYSWGQKFSVTVYVSGQLGKNGELVSLGCAC